MDGGDYGLLEDLIPLSLAYREILSPDVFYVLLGGVVYEDVCAGRSNERGEL